MQHTCTMFCGCLTAQLVAGGTAALRAGQPSGNAPASIRDALVRVEQENATTTRRRDPR